MPFRTEPAGLPAGSVFRTGGKPRRRAPAPAVITLHGDSDNLSQVLPLSKELARRGYVVLALDCSGSGETEVGNTDEIVNTAIDQLLALEFVKPEIICAGYSMSGIYSFNAATERSDVVKLVLSNGMDAKGDTLTASAAPAPA